MKINKNNSNSLKYLFKLYLMTRIVLVVFLVVAEFLLSNKINGEYGHVLELFDNEHYLSIAQDGYLNNMQYAFFPLIPLLIRYLGKWGFLFFNQICVFLSGYLLYLISDKIFKSDNVYSASLLYFISPISIFTCMFYSEGLFLFLTILAFYLFKTKKNYLVLGIVLGLSVMTRSLGSMLFFSIFVFMLIDFIKKREKFKNILLVYIPATIISCLYPVYLWFKTGDFLYFMTVQSTHWGRIGTNILTIMFDVGKYIINDPKFLFIFDYILVFGLIIFMVVFIFKNRKRKNYYEMFLYVMFSLVAICSSIRANNNALASFYRYIFGCFPIYFMLSKNYLTFGLMIFVTTFITIFFLMGIHFY